MAFLFKRKQSKFWQIGWYDPVTGKPGSPVSTRTQNKKLAEQMMKDFEKELAGRKVTGTAPTDQLAEVTSILLSEAFKLYQQDKVNTGEALSDLTLRNYKTALNNLYRTAGDKQIHTYTRDDYNAFVEGLWVRDANGKALREMSQNSKAIYTKCVFALFAWLTEEKYIPDNPMKRVVEEEKEFVIISAAELKKIRDYTEEKTKYTPLLEYLVLSAFRIQEALNLKYSDICENIIKVKGKGGKYDYIPIIPEMREYLKTLPSDQGGEELVFPGKYRAFHQYWRRMIKATGLRDDITPHDLRKYCLSKMANAGVPINFVQRYARHSSIQTTMKYYIRADDSRMVDEIAGKVKLLID